MEWEESTLVLINTFTDSSRLLITRFITYITGKHKYRTIQIFWLLH